MQTVKYGSFDSQVADLYLPGELRPPVVCLLHGGFWRMPYGRGEMTPIAWDLVARGFAVWNLEYRRLGAPGGGWPGTLEDVSAGIDHLATLVAQGADLNLDCVTIVGHSAGGHLALLAAAYERRRGNPGGSSRVRPSAVVGLAAIVDLASAHALGSGNNAVSEFLGGSPQQQPDRYAAASPIALTPLGVKQLIVHGTSDEALPIELARIYTKTAIAAGDIVEFVELPGTGHMDYLDPSSVAHASLYRWLMLHSNKATLP